MFILSGRSEVVRLEQPKPNLGTSFYGLAFKTFQIPFSISAKPHDHIRDERQIGRDPDPQLMKMTSSAMP